MKTGIVDKIREAKSTEEVKSLLVKLDTYKYVSSGTKRRAIRKARETINKLPQ